tara:strand:+ start:291 stop:632 length:342 start_codon:yes stop_codon:yes gene_type:complete
MKELERKLKTEEYQLLKCMLKNLKEYDFNLDNLKVVDVHESEMGSIYIINPLVKRENRKINKTIIERQFKDIDGVPISVCINIDTDGCLFELDIWKIDFNPLINYPSCAKFGF